MELSNYIIDIKKAINIINENNFKIIALQIPEGLKNISNKIINEIIKNTGSDVILIADPCYGSCDIPYNDLIDLKVDLIIHIGHTDMKYISNDKLPILFIDAISTIDISNIVEKSISYLEGKNIGIVTTAQHVYYINKIKEILENQNLIPYISKGDNKINNCGQILGCNLSSAKNLENKVDSFLFVGSGHFHPIGLLLSLNKPVIAANPFSDEIKKDELNEIKTKILKQRYGAITLAKESDTFGLLIGLKPGQRRLNLALKIKKQLESYNKNSYLFALNNFNPININYIKYIDCFISTSCPRIAIDDYKQYKKPIITPIEFEIAMGIRKWSDYIFDNI